MKARIIVTKECHRYCDGCCNGQEAFSDIEVIKGIQQLLQYDELMITGGEPMLVPLRLYKFVRDLRLTHKYNGKIYLYTARYVCSLNEIYHAVSQCIDGFTFTMHHNSNDADIMCLKQLSELIPSLQAGTYRLSIDNRLYERYDFANIDMTAWSVVRKLHWSDKCQLPEGERLFIYEL